MNSETPSAGRAGMSRHLAERNAIIRTLDHVKAIAEFSLDGELLYANPRFLDIFGYQPEQVLGAHHSLFCDQAFAASPAYARFWARLGEGQAYTDLCERRAADGSPRWLEATYAPIFDAEGRVERVFKMASDVTQRIRREQEAQEQTRRLSLVADATDNAVLITDSDWRIVYVNSGFERMFGMKLAQVLGQVPPRLLAPQISEGEIATLHAGLRAGIPIRREELLRGGHGERYWCSIATSPVLDGAGTMLNAISVVTDITDSKMHQVMQHRVLEAIAAERSLIDVIAMVCEEVDRILPDAASCVIRFDRSGRMTPLSAPRLPFEYLEHLSRHSLHPGMIAAMDDCPLVEGGAFIDIDSDERWTQFRAPMRAAGYRAFWAMPIRTGDGSIAGAVVFHYPEHKRPADFQRKLMGACVHLCALALERERAKAEIHRLAFFDPLTELPNRSLLSAKAEQALATATREGTSAAVVFIDVDRFKHVNDSLGHPAGDGLLKALAARLQKGRRGTDIVGRLSGDEFVLMLPGCDAGRAAEIIERLQHEVGQPVDIGGTAIRPSVSMGVAMFPADGNCMEMLLHRADMAMYQAKSEARGSFAFFSSELNAAAQERLLLEADLRQALHHGGLHLNYQPQVDLASGRLHGAEVLARWRHPTRGDVPPSRFIPLAEECGLIDELSQWVLETACAQVAQWRRLGLPLPTFSINLSPLSLHDASLPRLIARTLQAHGLQTRDLIVEITEGVMLDQHSAAMQTIAELDAMGVKLSMDDFGTGYSSLSYLHRLPISELKVDRSFVADLGYRESARPLCEAFMRIGASLGISVVAEGVETEAQRRLLAEQGCRVAQGYFFSRPMSGADFPAWVGQHALTV